ncbi:hypothetical protein SCLCIDRAFT_1214684 [Scleroderma citrinum Foug A]|uniref:Uncharacterized protein n=1 Tax=Scleroderma citrinum Foug A TaxID=1036808 RepID=A0A0C3AD76_9AGAM|nr:hypothetical protein SCLCIDRAFT_1214684 [Scleroderma citrinum Foug A]
MCHKLTTPMHLRVFQQGAVCTNDDNWPLLMPIRTRNSEDVSACFPVIRVCSK